MAPDRVIFASFGNDSVALIQWAHEHGMRPTVAYTNTGWAAAKWPDRVARGRAWVESGERLRWDLRCRDRTRRAREAETGRVTHTGVPRG